MTKRVSVFACVLLLSALAANGATAAEPDGWPNWRGPFGNGVAAAGKYPTQWSSQDHVAWQTALPGRGASTPVISGGQVYVASVSEDANILQAYSLTGQSQWQQPIGKPRKGKHGKATGSNSSPVTDGKLVYAYFKSGDLACLTTAGKPVWQINLQEKYGEDTLWWDLGTSPVLTEKAIVIAVMQSGPSYLLALDRQTGQELWRANREMSAPDEANQSYSTPIVAQIDGQEVLLTLGADHLTCHATSDGKLLWQQGGFNPSQGRFMRSIASPVLAGDLVICPYTRGASLTAIRLKAASEADRIAWHRTDLGSDVPTPTISQNRLYVVGDKGMLWCLDPASGKTIWEEQLPKSRLAYSSSPVVAGGHVYITREDATTFVVKDADKFELVATNTLDSSTVSTPVPAGDRISLRTYEKLYCFQP
jgi:outer membrane protein assembly factor BamB